MTGRLLNKEHFIAHALEKGPSTARHTCIETLSRVCEWMRMGSPCMADQGVVEMVTSPEYRMSKITNKHENM